MSQDEGVISTNDDATACKRFAVQLGYWSDSYIQHFSKLGERKTPEINRGYYARVKGMRTLLDQFLSQTRGNCQVINLGAGFDSLFWLLKEEGLAPKLFVEVDFGNVTSRKCYCIRARRKLQEVFSEEDELKIDGNEAHSKNYHLLSADLREISVLESKLNEIGIDKSLPTVFITECVLVYMEPEHSSAIINWAGTNFKTALFINYEQVNMQDRFGQVMIQNLRGRNCELLGASACPDLDSHKQRFLSNNWEKAEVLDMMNVYNCLPYNDRTRIERIEFLDEVDLLQQLLSHYCIAWAVNDAAQLGLSSIAF